MADRDSKREPTKAQSVRLKLTHSHDLRSTTGFRPLSLPDTGELLLDQLSAASIESLSAKLHVRLHSGTYGLPLTQGDHQTMDGWSVKKHTPHRSGGSRLTERTESARG